MIVSILNKSEQALVKRVAKERSEYDKANGFTDHRKAEKQTAEFIEQNGLGGELAFCKAFNVFPDVATDYPSEHDAVLPNGIKVEIKTTEYKTGKLIVRRMNDADVYVLVTGTFPNYNIIGYITSAELSKLETELQSKSGKKNKAFVAMQEDLQPIEDLLPRMYTNIIKNARRRTPPKNSSPTIKQSRKRRKPTK